jgi:hypothetical protein
VFRIPFDMMVQNYDQILPSCHNHFGNVISIWVDTLMVPQKLTFHDGAFKPDKTFYRTDSRARRYFVGARPQILTVHSSPIKHFADSRARRYFVGARPQILTVHSSPIKHFADSRARRYFVGARPQILTVHSSPIKQFD